MNKRIVLLNKDENGNFNSDYVLGFDPNSVFFTQSPCKNATVPVMVDKSKEDIIKNLGPGDGVLVMDPMAFAYLRQFYHFGIRGENFFDCSKLDRLSIENGAFIKCIYESKPTDIEKNYFLSPEFCNEVKFQNFQHSVIHNVQDALRMLNYFDSLSENQLFGFDYEASGMPLDKEFEISGASICTESFGGFISFTDCRHHNTKEEYQLLLTKLGKFLEKRQRHIWVYNMQYEFQVSHRMLGVTLYNLCDASTINVLDGHHLKKYSLKWTAQRVLRATVWDTEFDRISELIDKMLFIEVGNTKKTKEKILKVDQFTFQNTDEWLELCSRYPNYVEEFKDLIIEYWGNPYMCIPSDILGHYCNLDSFYTLMICMSRLPSFSNDAVETFLDNSRLGSLLHSTGLYIDEEFRLRYHDESLKMMAWGITYCATANCRIKLNFLANNVRVNIAKFNPVAQKLLKENKFFSGDCVEITKYLLSSNIDTLECTETGLNEGGIVFKYGQNFAVEFIDLVKKSMAATKLKRIDGGIVKKKKIIGLISEELKKMLGITDSNKYFEKVKKLEEYLYYEGCYLELCRVSRECLNDINNIPSTITAFGQNLSIKEYSEFISTNDKLFKCKSPIENDKVCYQFADLYRCETAYLAAIFESTQQLNGAEKFYENLGITTVTDAFQHFMNSWETYENSNHTVLGDYPEKVYSLALKYWRKIGDGPKASGDPSKEKEDEIKEVWSNFNGFIAQSQFFSYVNKEFVDYGKPFDETDFNDKFKFMRKFVINYLLYKKYSKVLSTYIDGMFKANNKWVIEGEDHIPIREALPNEPGAIEKCFVHYEVNTKSSKRWSSGFHTIISHSDLKDCIATPPAWDENGEIIYGGSDYVLTYFDISSAEVKAAGFASMDPDLIAKFNAGEDIYIYSAKLYLGDHFDTLDKAQKKMWRKRFKTIFLGVLYGLGKKSLAERLNATEEEAEDIIKGLYKSFPKLREYVDSQQRFPLNNNGYINTMLGDKLQISEWKYYVKTNPYSREGKNLEARIKRLGVNLPIQGGTSSIMASGFMNNIRVSADQWGLNRALKPIIVVHDSNTNYVPVERIFEIRKFYDKYYTDYCASFGPKIKLLFDLLCGDSYERAMEMKSIDDNTIQFTGSAYSIQKIYNKLMNCKSIKVECDTPYENIVPQWVTDPIDRFIQEKGTCIIKDNSRYTVSFTKVG